MSSTLQLQRDGAVATVWLDRADKRNALDGELMRAFAGALDELASEPAIRVVVVRGRGPVFSSGIDHNLLRGVFEASQQTPFLHLHHELQQTFHRMTRLEKPVIAVLHGAAVGMALELALAADLRIATTECVVGLPEIAFGIVPDVGGTTRLVRAVGEPRARELILTGRLVKAATAARYGLVHEVVEPAALDDVVRKRVDSLLVHPRAALGMAKVLCQVSAETDSTTSFRLEGVVQQSLLSGLEPARFASAVAFIKAQLAAAE